jgi:DNA-binding beta-propeller fold protein YncE
MNRSPRLHPWAARAAFLSAAVALAPLTSRAQLMLSGNENKIELTSSGGPKVVPNPTGPDSLTLIDFATSPPTLTNILDVPNSVVGPPSNVAFSPDGKLALVANSIKLDPSAPTGFVPESYVHVVDLSAKPPKVVGRVQTDQQPSGLSFAPNGKVALVANRASGTVGVLALNGTEVKQVQSVKVCEPADSVADVGVSPDGRLALAAVQKAGGYLAVLRIDESGKVTATGRKVSVYGQPYKVVFTPDGELALAAGTGAGNGVDTDALSVIDLKAPNGPRTVDFVPLGAGPETIEISPDGRLIAAAMMEGSNLKPSDPNLTDRGALVVLERRGRTFVKTQSLPVGRIPEGVAFTSDGKRLVVQCHPDRQLWVFDVRDNKVSDTAQRLTVPGMPSSLRAAPAK